MQTNFGTNKNMLFIKHSYRMIKDITLPLNWHTMFIIVIIYVIQLKTKIK